MKTLKSALLVVVGLSLASLPVSAKPVAPGNMVAYCRGEASAEYQTKPVYIKTQKLVRNKDGSYHVKGTADLGNQGQKPFQCNYDKKGEFKGVMSLVNEGAL
jgi:hypothetical protein